VLRNIGVPLGNILIAISSTMKGLGKLILHEDAIKADLDRMWNVVAEGIQTILRREEYPNPYEALKQLTRVNTTVTAESISQFIDSLEVSDAVKAELHALSPSTYTGY
ncbi:MAG: adenylosuccinate lyase, partial [Muribaculaceae bacterium]|nr:adenylosuccinate lyase [Muribaculaceae bacterium]